MFLATLTIISETGKAKKIKTNALGIWKDSLFPGNYTIKVDKIISSDERISKTFKITVSGNSAISTGNQKVEIQKIK